MKEDEEDQLFLSSTKAQNDRADFWYIDSGCSNHMIGNRHFLWSLFIISHRTLSLVAENYEGLKEKVLLQFMRREVTKCSLVMFIMFLIFPLRKGYFVLFDNTCCKIIDKKANVSGKN